MKKTICFLLLCLVLVFTGCDQAESETTAPKEETTTMETTTVEKETETSVEEGTTPFWNEEETIELPPIKF